MHLVGLFYCPELIPERRKKAKLMKRKQKGKNIYTYLFKKTNESLKNTCFVFTTINITHHAIPVEIQLQNYLVDVLDLSQV